jgi:GT2 family glycosyltransferase
LKPLSFVIITYNRPADMLDLARNITGLKKAEELLEEVIIVNNASAQDYTGVKLFIAENPLIPFRFIDSAENLGVARGRNFALKQGKAPYVIMLDDDAVLQNDDALINLFAEFSNPAAGRPVAIISFKVLYFDTKEMQVNAFPHKMFSVYCNKPFFHTYYFAGGAHAIRREVLDKTGNYPEDFFYGMEEYDLSYRILDAGYSIVYSDKVIMLHKESPLGRKTKKEKMAMLWINKSKCAWRYLPLLYFFTTAILWSAEYLGKTGFDLAGWFKGWLKIMKIPSSEKRTTVKPSTLEYLTSVEARLWY